MIWNTFTYFLFFYFIDLKKEYGFVTEEEYGFKEMFVKYYLKRKKTLKYY